jgi:type I restriction enzyme M protein
MTNHSEISEFLWKIADLIKDDYEAKDYEDMILPFTLLRRLDCVLEPTRDALLKKAAGQSFYNTSEYSLSGLLKFPNDSGVNFNAYLNGFFISHPSPNWNRGGSSYPFPCIR